MNGFNIILELHSGPLSIICASSLKEVRRLVITVLILHRGSVTLWKLSHLFLKLNTWWHRLLKIARRQDLGSFVNKLRDTTFLSTDWGQYCLTFTVLLRTKFINWFTMTEVKKQRLRKNIFKEKKKKQIGTLLLSAYTFLFNCNASLITFSI